MSRTLAELAQAVGAEVQGDGQVRITGAATLLSAGPGEIAFLANPRYSSQLARTRASAVIVGREQRFDFPLRGVSLLRAEDPYYAFQRIMVLLYGQRRHKRVGISPQAVVAPTARLGRDVNVHPFVVICDGAEIGDRTTVYPGCFIGENVRIGDDCVLYPNVVVYENCRLGRRVTIHAGTVIGEDGFGYATHQGVHHKIPQIGAVVIGDEVEIGACCAIDRGTLGDTEIGAGSKFSNLVTIGHNTVLGKGCLLVAQVGIAGSVTVGDYVAMGGQAGVAGHLKIGSNVRIGAQAGVIRNVGDNQELLGSPAIPRQQAQKAYSLIAQLPAIRSALRTVDANVREFLRQQDRRRRSWTGRFGRWLGGIFSRNKAGHGQKR